MRRALPLVLALLLVTPGCGTVVCYTRLPRNGVWPLPFRGVYAHLQLMVGFTSLYLALFPFTFADLALCLAADTALLPVAGIGALAGPGVEEAPPPPPVAPQGSDLTPAPRPLGAAESKDVVAAERWRRARARFTPGLEEALARAGELAPADRARREALRRDRGSILHREDAFFWLPEAPAPDDPVLVRYTNLAGPGRPLVYAAHVAERTGEPAAALEACEQLLDRDPADGVAWTIRGWAHLATSELDRAEADLLLGAALVGTNLHAGWAIAGLGRVHEARGDREGALERYVAALGCLPQVPPGQAARDASLELRARVKALRAR